MAAVPQDTQALMDLVRIAHARTDGPMLQIMVNRIAAKPRDGYLWGLFKELSASKNPADAYGLNILAACYYGVIMGGPGMSARKGSEPPRVDPFLHNLRKAILQCPATASLAKSRARINHFYPEFDSTEPRERVIDASLAHSNMGPANEELTILYSLGGFFDWDTANTWKDSVGKGPTTCVMTARAVYHAAGLNILGSKDPTVGTPNGADDALGLPAKKYSAAKNKNITVTTVRRDDQNQWAGGYDATRNDQADMKPQFLPGDIYLVNGEPGHEQLLRGGGALATHVGLVVRMVGDIVDTVDGGNGNGGSVKFCPNRRLILKEKAGWTFSDSSLSFGKADFKNLDIDMQPYMDKSNTAMLDAWIMTVKDLKMEWDGIERDIAQLKKQDKTELAAKAATRFEILRERARKLRRQTFSSTMGELRTIQGWWKPSQYQPLSRVEQNLIQLWVAQAYPKAS